ncbi:monooxygenase [Agrobacterium sp. AGB01]|uniref:acyl-CoA dehydrogenase family protein n=1 Tax=Agrobacterium sp. AGB01 TaxID=2769302 RepID=UPI001780BE94|nr:acyl-CoA dehydrogenase family protein [Agrobacterium sp. AGB01]MBD9388556.1 monooxygenase [Agrobacterium sp. AGB01]
MTQLDHAWGAGPSDRFEILADRFRPIFNRIAEGALARETARVLPHEPIAWLKQAGFMRARLPEAEGGLGASASDIFALLIELSEADSNVTQALRAHFGFVEDIVGLKPGPRRTLWVERIAKDESIGSAWTEIGDAPLDGFATRISHKDGAMVLNGAKFYTTGSLFADWIDIGATHDETGETLAVTVRRDSIGVEVVDDWDGFGQIGTASGTARFSDVAVSAQDAVLEEGRFLYSPAFYQLVHLATLAGIGRAIVRDVADVVKNRRRTYSNAASSVPATDPQVLQVIGRARSAAYSASAITLQVARALDRAADARLVGDWADYRKAVDIAELETSQSLTVVSGLILDAATNVFDAVGASATRKGLALDRHWRNARTLSSHNPRVYKDRIVGDYAVNGTLPPEQWQIGTPA